ncbi:unnamed protein product [Fraxinus pennsylvanica]|uniref:Pentatricopeptide repeat-containing protein n=1 Tax=Fraxinus pennsylvanica TaxID=56036 RepID=A0AAD1ZDT6_9LAMI|nr:unnamed protein product [Fraxinus pennsylvanica]
MKADLVLCNAALECCCCKLESVSGVEKVINTISILGIKPDEFTFGACVSLGLLDKAHNILDEMNAQKAFVGIEVSVSILKAYGKEQGTVEAAKLVTEISSLGLQLDVGSYESLVEASMSC